MEYVYTAMLLHKAGKEITEDAVSKILKAAGVDADSSRVKALVAALSGVNIEEAIEKAAVAAAPAAAPVAAVAAPAEENKQEKKVEEPDSGAGLGALFG
jgi:large subunit ribosomal protein L12